jgi:hypothetical protein
LLNEPVAFITKQSPTLTCLCSALSPALSWVSYVPIKLEFSVFPKTHSKTLFPMLVVSLFQLENVLFAQGWQNPANPADSSSANSFYLLQGPGGLGIPPLPSPLPPHALKALYLFLSQSGLGLPLCLPTSFSSTASLKRLHNPWGESRHWGLIYTGVSFKNRDSQKLFTEVNQIITFCLVSPVGDVKSVCSLFTA